MAAVTVRNLRDETHRALKARAALHGQSTEAEIRAILDEAVRPATRLGSLLRSVGRRVRGADLETTRDRTPVAVATFR